MIYYLVILFLLFFFFKNTSLRVIYNFLIFIFICFLIYKFIIPIVFIVIILGFILSAVIYILYKLNIIKKPNKFNRTYTYYYTNNDYANYNNRNNNFNNNSFNRYDEYKKACDVIGANVNESYEEKKKKRNSMLKKYHPDFFSDEKEKERATEITNKINAAWEIIEKYNKNK